MGGNVWLYGLIINELKEQKMITKDEQSKLRSTIALLSSMVNSGEQHSEQSRKEVSEALSIVNNLPIQRVVNPVVCDNPLHNTQVEADGRCHWCEGKELIQQTIVYNVGIWQVSHR